MPSPPIACSPHAPDPAPLPRSGSRVALGRTGLALCVLLVVGCSSGKKDGWNFASKWQAPTMPWAESNEPPPTELPRRLVASWTEATVHRPGENPKRGFGGRLVFFGEGKPEPVRVDGQLVVYAFDETTRSDYDLAPTRRYVFPAEKFAKHESDSQFGASYSIFLPWDEVGGDAKKISLIVRFEPQGGPVVLSEQTRHYLPGRDPAASPQQAYASSQPAPKTDQPDPKTIRQASFEETANAPPGSEPSPDRRASPTVVRIPSRLVERMAAPKK